MTEIYRTPTGVSVLDDLGLDPAFIVKAKLAIRIHLTIKELGLTSAMPPGGWAFRTPNSRNCGAESLRG